MMKPLILALACAALSACASTAGEAPAETEAQASIPFAGTTIRNWRAVDNDTLLIEGAQNRWYRATFFGPCPEARYAQSIGFITEGTGSLDRFSGIVAEGRQCRFRSLVEIPDPDAAAEAEAEDAN